jgi:hypothetical protein
MPTSKYLPKSGQCTAANIQLYSITSSARCWRNQGTSRPSALAVLRLITNSNLVGCTTGTLEYPVGVDADLPVRIGDVGPVVAGPQHGGGPALHHATELVGRRTQRRIVDDELAARHPATMPPPGHWTIAAAPAAPRRRGAACRALGERWLATWFTPFGRRWFDRRRSSIVAYLMAQARAAPGWRVP